MDRDPNAKSGALTGEVRLRVPLPIIVPFGALLLIALLVFGFSRILLSVPKEIATIIAMVTAANVVGACAVLALRKNMNRSIMTELAIVVMYPVIVGAVIATMNLDAEHGAEEGPSAAPPGDQQPAPDEGTTVTASGTAFDTNEIELTAGETNEIEFINEDTVPHNVSVYEDDSASKAVFEGELITDDSITYEIELGTNQPAEAYFQCDVHPAMNGTVTIN